MFRRLQSHRVTELKQNSDSARLCFTCLNIILVFFFRIHLNLQISEQNNRSKAF